MEDIRKIVEDSRNIDISEKDLLKQLFSCLAQKQDSLFENIKKEINENWQKLFSKAKNEWHVATALIENSESSIAEAKDNHFEPILKIDGAKELMNDVELKPGENKTEACVGVIFLNCDFSEIDNYCKKKYIATISSDIGNFEASYRLVPFICFLDQEEIVERTALQYNVFAPPIYSPASRRAVSVMIEINGIDEKTLKKSNINLRYDDNSLKGIVLDNRLLVWNVKIDLKENIPAAKECVDKSVRPLFDRLDRVYSFNFENNEYLYAKSDNLNIKRFGDSIHIGVTPDESIETLDYKKVTLEYYSNDYLKQCEFSFTNEFLSNNNIKRRIRTIGDILSVASCFEKLQIIECRNDLKGAKSIVTYDKRRSYHYSKDPHFRATKALCYLQIKQYENDIFFEDYVSYFMAFMNYYYPEFYWVGVY